MYAAILAALLTLFGFFGGIILTEDSYRDRMLENCSAQYNSTTGEFELINMCEVK